MSTNAVIRLDGFNIELYKHWDGDPDSTKPWLEKFNKAFVKKRGDNLTYKFAQLLRSSVRMGEEFNLDDSDFTGWGVSKCGEHYYDYLYVLKSDGTVTVERRYQCLRMDIYTVRDNLVNTINGKKKLVVELESQPNSLVANTTIDFLKLSISELSKILNDVEQCINGEHNG